MQIDWALLKNFIIAMLAVLNPLGKVPVWTELTGDLGQEVRVRIARMTVSTAGLVLLLFLISGKYLLQFFQMELASFQIGGGILVLVISLDMIKGTAVHLGEKQQEGESPKHAARVRFQAVMVPLAIPMIAGPATLTTVLVYGTRSNSWLDLAVMVAVLLLVLLVVLLVFSRSIWLERALDPVVFQAITRVFGVILAGLAIQLIVEGLGEVFPAWMGAASVIKDDVSTKLPPKVVD